MTDGTRQLDILEVIADLSNDEVRTSPRIVNQVLDLLPEEVWRDETLRWLDPGCKTGSFLREVTKRLLVGLEEQITDEGERLEHILKNMVFGIAITDLTALMSRRTVYCSKDASGERSIVQMESTEGNICFGDYQHEFAGGHCKDCGATEEIFGDESEGERHAYGFIHESARAKVEGDITMNFDVIIGNPPYQIEADAAGKNVVPIYDQFVEQAKALNPKYISMIIPSRWMIGGRGLEEFRKSMLSDDRISALVDYPDSAELFPAVDVKSGICYFLWERDRRGKATVSTRRSGVEIGPEERKLDEYDVLVRDGRALPIVRRVLAMMDGSPLSDVISARDPFGPELGSNVSGFRRSKRSGDVRLYLNQDSASDSLWIDRSRATRNLDLIDAWKLLLPKAGPGNSGGHVLPDVVLGRPVSAGPQSVCSATYLVAGPLPNEDAAASLGSYVRSRFVRFLVSLRKPSQNTTRDCYLWVPQQSWDREWTDDELYEKYEITEAEQAYIAEMVKEMPS